MLTELKNRGVQDVCIAVCDGLKALPDAITTVWELTVVQACIIHLLRNTFRFASRKYWDQIARDLRPVYTAASEAEALARFEEFEEKWGKPYPAISRLWRNAWSEFIPFLDYDVEIRKIICSTNAIESINARYRRAVRARGHFPSDQAALKCLYLVTRSLDPTGKGKARWAMRWLSRPGAQCRHYCRSISPGRSPNRACAFQRTRLSTVSCPEAFFAGRGRNLLAPVSVAGDRYCGRVDQDHSVGSEGKPCPAGCGESAAELAPSPAVSFAKPPDHPPVHEVAELIQGVLADGMPEVVGPAAQDLVDPGDHRAHVRLRDPVGQATHLRP